MYMIYQFYIEVSMIPVLSGEKGPGQGVSGLEEAVNVISLMNTSLNLLALDTPLVSASGRSSNCPGIRRQGHGIQHVEDGFDQ
jgi:hypothetical protein